MEQFAPWLNVGHEGDILGEQQESWFLGILNFRKPDCFINGLISSSRLGTTKAIILVSAPT